MDHGHGFDFVRLGCLCELRHLYHLGRLCDLRHLYHLGRLCELHHLYHLGRLFRLCRVLCRFSYQSQSTSF